MSNEDEIVTVSVDVIAPNGAVRKDLEKRCEFGLDRFRIAVINGKPLRNHAAWIQVTFHQLVILLRIKRGSPFDPWVYRISRNDVEFIRCCEDVVPGIIVHETHTAIVEHVVVLVTEVSI